MYTYFCFYCILDGKSCVLCGILVEINQLIRIIIGYLFDCTMRCVFDFYSNSEETKK